MKNTAIIILLIVVAGGAYYFWMQSQSEAPNKEKTGTNLQVQVNPTPEGTKYIPPNAVMEDGTIE